jgi:prepilin peptidase CpaA
MTVLETALLLSFPVAMAFAAANDLFTMTIPNKISLALIVLFAASALVVGMPLQDAAIHVGVGLAVLVFGFVLFQFNMLGGGDAKLMAAGALWMGIDHVLFFMAYLTIFGGLLAVAILFYRRWIPVHKLKLPGWAVRLHRNGTGIPYGIAIAAAALMLYPETTWFHALPV